MSIYTPAALTLMAEDVLTCLQEMKPDFPNDITFDSIYKHIRNIPKETGKRIKYIDEETLYILLGILTGQNKVEIQSAHGRGVGYFFIVRITEKESA